VSLESDSIRDRPGTTAEEANEGKRPPLSNRSTRASASWSVLCLLLCPLSVLADDLTGSTSVPATLSKADPKPERELTGREIYSRVLENTYDSFIQVSSLYSGDRGGNEQFTRFKMWFKNAEQEGVEPKKGDVVSRSRVQYTEPFDIRHSGYLILTKNEEIDDQFVYMPSQRRVKRVNLRGEAVFGTDFSFEDILPRELEDADYIRKPDEETLGRDCFVIEAIPNELAASEYTKILIHVDKERSVPVLTRYWDDRNIEIKELRTNPDSVELIDAVWVTREMTMRHLKFETYTRFELASVKPNAKLGDTMFELRRLESHGR
jgi:hypothetical protein